MIDEAVANVLLAPASPTNKKRSNSIKRVPVPTTSSIAQVCKDPTPSNYSEPAPMAQSTGSSSSTQNPWKPRWAPMLRKASISENVTVYTTVAPRTAPMPSSSAGQDQSKVSMKTTAPKQKPIATDGKAPVPSQPPAIQLDDTSFGRPFSTTGLLDLDPSRFSFLDMSGSQNHASDSEGEATSSASTLVHQKPGKPLQLDSAVAHFSTSTGMAPTGDANELLQVPLSASSFSIDDSRSSQNSFVGSSPALASLISSFPSPNTRGQAQPPAVTGLPLPPLPELPAPPAPISGLEDKHSNWDGGERFQAEHRTKNELQPQAATPQPPFLDMSAKEVPPRDPVHVFKEHLIHSTPDSASSSPRSRPSRLPPPRPVPTAALPQPPMVAPDQSQPHQARGMSHAGNRSSPKPLVLPALQSRLNARKGFPPLSHSDPASSTMSTTRGPAKVALPSGPERLDTPQSPTMGDVANSLDIPREAVRQMVDTTQHVWRNHLLGSRVAGSDAAIPEVGEQGEQHMQTDQINSAQKAPVTGLQKSSGQPAVKYNFSRPMPPDVTKGMGGDEPTRGLPSHSSTLVNDQPIVLRSPLLLKGETEATGFAQFVADEDATATAGSAVFGPSRTLPFAHSPKVSKANPSDATTEKVLTSIPLAEKPELNEQSKSPKLTRRNSESSLEKPNTNTSKRDPGELHAWSVCINDNGIPAIRPTASAFHRPGCPVAGKGNATWQCGCRRCSADRGNAVHPSTQHKGSLSASKSMDLLRQADLWTQVEESIELIREHEMEIHELQDQVARISSEIASRRPSASTSAYASPDLASVPSFSAPRAEHNNVVERALPPKVQARVEKPLPNAPAQKGSKPFPSSGPGEDELSFAAAFKHNSARKLYGRLASLSKLNLSGRDEMDETTPSPIGGQPRLRSSSSTSSLNKVFRFPWNRSSDKEPERPQPATSSQSVRGHGKSVSASVASSNAKAVSSRRQRSVDWQRSLPTSRSESGKDKRYPPSSRKYSYDMLHGPDFHTSVGSGHLRGQSSSSKASSIGTSIFSRDEGHEMTEHSRFGALRKFGRRWDSFSSRGTNASAHASIDLTRPTTAETPWTTPAAPSSKSVAQPTFESTAARKALPSLPTKPLPPSPADHEGDARTFGSVTDDGRRTSMIPPRRSSLRKSSESCRNRTGNAPEASQTQIKEVVMHPIDEQSELGSPASGRVLSIHAEPDSNPASPKGGVRMSMSERYRLQGLTVPAPLPLSSPLASATDADGFPKLPVLPRSASVKSPLPVAFSKGSLTVARRPSLQ